MNMHISTMMGGLGRVSYLDARDMAEYGTAIGFDEHGDKIDTQDDLVDRVARKFHTGIQMGALRSHVDRRGRNDAAVAHDTAAEFYTNRLQQMLTTITRAPSSTSVMTGSDPVLPQRVTLRAGQTDLLWETETPTGAAGFIEPSAMQKLPQVGEFVEQEKRSASWCGIGYGWGLVESWQAAERGGPSLDQSRATTARATLLRFIEAVLLRGNATREIPGLLSNNNALYTALATKIASITSPTDALKILQIINHHFQTAAASYGGSLSRMIAPLTDRYYLERMRYGAAQEGALAWDDFTKACPWLMSTRWIDGLQTWAPTGGSLWVGMSDDDNELWSEVDAVPMLFGPFSVNPLRMEFALISHIGGVINRRPERLAHYAFPA
jgi:hypothetical protein